MLRARLIIGVFCLFTLFAGACASSQGSKNAWKGVRSFYGSHINKSVFLEVDNRVYCAPHEVALVRVMGGVDFQLEQLLRAMDDSDRSPDGEWAEAMFKKFPWLAAVALADGQGRVFESLPEKGGVNSVETLLNHKPGRNRTDLRALAREGRSGPEFLLAKPVYMQNELRALILCRFNLYDLLRLAGQPDKFVFSTTGGILWPAGYNIEETPLNGVDWENLGANHVDGTLSNARGEFYWLSTYFADLRLYYSLPVAGDF
ncbi:MAG: hypothetical protein FWF99_06865 [Desulfovibrionaceae bacterium]|nr:hypothetical protein [Desulfovibrionaceae bacterium]